MNPVENVPAAISPIILRESGQEPLPKPFSKLIENIPDNVVSIQRFDTSNEKPELKNKDHGREKSRRLKAKR